jgi:hypothetical protein
MADFRGKARQRIPGKLKVHWHTAEGHSFHKPAVCLDISATGAQLEIETGIAPSTVVQLESPHFKIVGVAVVRHCQNKGMKFRVGVEFSGGLKWEGAAPA